MAEKSAEAVPPTAEAAEQKTTTAITGVPYRAFLRNTATRALMFTHFCNNWFHYTMLAWLPTFFTQTLQLNIAQASTVSLLPSIAGVMVSLIAGARSCVVLSVYLQTACPACQTRSCTPSAPQAILVAFRILYTSLNLGCSCAGQLADKLIDMGVPVRQVRLLAQCTAFLVPAVCLVLACVSQGTYASIVFIAAALGLNSFALSGLYCTHADMSEKFAGPLLGLTNTSGAVPGILGVAIVGVLLQVTDSWQLALFAPIIFFFILGTAVYSLYASSEAQDYSDNSPFEFEGKLSNALKFGGQQKH